MAQARVRSDRTGTDMQSSWAYMYVVIDLCEWLESIVPPRCFKSGTILLSLCIYRFAWLTYLPSKEGIQPAIHSQTRARDILTKSSLLTPYIWSLSGSSHNTEYPKTRVFSPGTSAHHVVPHNNRSSIHIRSGSSEVLYIIIIVVLHVSE